LLSKVGAESVLSIFKSPRAGLFCIRVSDIKKRTGLVVQDTSGIGLLRRDQLVNEMKKGVL
jgi:hypothetical protein